jgi:tripartite-type tricarboxylate transporter receptor subunit TctC
MTDLLSGRVNISFDSYTVYAGHIKSGKVKALAGIFATSSHA